jgi:hypothetical protein
MNKQEQKLFYSQMDDIIPIMNERDQTKIDFVKSFMEKRFQVDDFDDSFVSIERLGTKSLMYLLFAMIIEYDSLKTKSLI